MDKDVSGVMFPEGAADVRLGQPLLAGWGQEAVIDGGFPVETDLEYFYSVGRAAS